jgi:hypothetical protein
MVSAISATSQSTSQISPANERAWHQSNLLGDWKGTIKQGNQPVEFKVLSINGNSAQVQYIHNGRTERGTAIVDKNSITFGNVTIATRNGTQAAFAFSYQPQGQLAETGTQTAVLTKAADPTANSNPLLGSWTGATADHSASFQVTSINGRDAQVKYTIDGNSGTGVGDIVGNAVLLGKIQFSNIDGASGKVTFQFGHKTIQLAVKKFTPKTA